MHTPLKTLRVVPKIVYTYTRNIVLYSPTVHSVVDAYFGVRIIAIGGYPLSIIV